MAQGPTTIYANMINFRLTPGEFVLEFGAHFPDRPGNGYKVLKPIPVEISRVDDETFLASFEEAIIAMTGFDAQDAYQSLVAELLDTFDTLVHEAHLAPETAAQLRVLRTHIAKA